MLVLQALPGSHSNCMKRRIYYILSCSVFLAIFSGMAEARSEEPAIGSLRLEQLDFLPLPNTRGLSEAIDEGNRKWIRGTISPHLVGSSSVFRIPSARIHDYELYMRQDGELTRIAPDTDSQSKSIRSRFVQHTVTPDDTVFYLRVYDHAPQLLEIELLEKGAFTVAESSHMLRIGIYYGLALMSLIFNLVFYLIFRDKRFISYCFLLTSIFVSFFYEDGMVHYLSYGQLNMDYLMVLNSAVSAIVSTPFTFYFLDLPHVFRRLRKWFLTMSGLLLLSVLVYVLTDSPVASGIVYLLCFLFAINNLYFAAMRFRKDVYARFLLISFSLVVATGLLYVLYTRVDISLFKAFNIHTFRLVSALEIICISFAIVFRVRALQNENDRYRAELDNYLKALEVEAASGAYRREDAGKDLPVKPSKQDITVSLREQYELTEREIEVLLCIWEGLTNKEIAERLFISVSTAKYHIGNLYVKLDVKNRNQVQVLKDALPGYLPGSY